MNYKQTILQIANKYFETHHKTQAKWPIFYNSDKKPTSKVTEITLPEWAHHIGVTAEDKKSKILLVPTHCVKDHSAYWQEVDWWRAAFDLLTMQAQISFEQSYGPIHSYSYKLTGLPKNLYDHAWVNRIFLFLRRTTAQIENIDESKIFTPLPQARIYLSHDVDYIKKTFPLRVKQSLFSLYNAAKAILSGDLKSSLQNIFKILKFGLSPGNYWQFNNIIKLEQQYGVTSYWNFYSKTSKHKKNLKSYFLDPSYSINNLRLQHQINSLAQHNNIIGLHQAFNTWACPQQMLLEKSKLEQVIKINIQSCRQHWLRFSLIDTWQAQEQAGFKLDMTLGFNDRPGFRNSGALRMPTWLPVKQKFSDELESIPLILMDSHLYDYAQMTEILRQNTIDSILDELTFVGGEASIVWHQRVYHSDYGWYDSYKYLLDGITKRGILTS